MQNRILKFRVWNKNLGEFLDDCSKDICRYFDDENGDLIFQQFTSLKDKLGREIYEGDIIQYNYPKNERNNKVLVRWTTEEYDNHPGFIIRDSFEQYGDYEVIGNIYENPELFNTTLISLKKDYNERI